MLDVDKEVAWERFTKRGRRGDVFERRFDEHTKLIPDIVEVMRRDGLTVHTVPKDEDVQVAVEKVAEFLGQSTW